MARRPPSSSAYARADAHTRAAKAAGYPARSVFKLQEIQRRVGLFRKGQRVLDLGAAPGSWSLYASKEVGPRGLVVAVDLSEIPGALPDNLIARQMDAFDAGADRLAELGPFDVVMSDMAPSTSGSKVQDQARSCDLCHRALELAGRASAPGAHFVAKFFMGGDFADFKRAVAGQYGQCRVIRPEATRNQSSEVFVVGLGRKAPASIPEG